VKPERRAFLIATGGAAAALAGCDRIAALRGAPPEPELACAPPDAEGIDLAQHVLNRCTFGARPGDRAELLALAPEPEAAIDAWLERQLAPAELDDARAERLVLRLDSLSAPLAELYEYKPQVLLRELTSATVLRACHSRRQLHEVLVELWTDHFNLDSSKGECAWLTTAHDRDALRPHALGRFRDLLGASATSPAMLWYLDGRANVKRRAGERPNENHARELLELHTLGVHGGYTQADVMEAARCLSGWTVRSKERFKKARVEFHAHEHDDGEKRVLGERFPAGQGAKDRDQLLDLVARHPSTARHVATKLCKRFLADEPPAAAVDAVARTFASSDGAIAATLRTLFRRPEFRGEEHAPLRGAKLKRPFHYLASILRATDATTDAGPALCSWLGRMGQAPFQYPTPDGYPQEASAWQSGLVWRWKLAAALTHDRIEGTRIDTPKLLAHTGGREPLARHLFGRRLAPRERALLLETDDLALLLAAPAFQRC
jgi:uncharacterized protein (DUF1800 family)